MTLREELELDVDQALTDIDRVGAGLAQVASQFKVDLADALSAFDAAPTVEVNADTANLTDEVTTAVDSADTVVTVDADTSEAETAIGNLEDVTAVEVPVSADTTQAQEDVAALGDQVQGLGEKAGGAGGGLSSLGGEASAFGVAAGLASHEAGALGSSIEGLVPAAAGPVAAIAAVTAVTAGFFDQAVKFESGVQRLNSTFGEFADRIETINVGNLSKDLVELNTDLGSSTTQVRNAVSSFGQLGIAAGASQEQVANSSSQIVALAARAVALNPALGSVGDAVEGLSRGLARGGRFAAGFQISLTSAEITARALQDTGKATADALTIYDKAAAGAAIATERYGDSIQQALDEGAQNPILQVRKLEQEFKNLTTTLGVPLVVPVIGLLTAAEPIFGTFATVLGSIARGLVPIGTAFVQLAGIVTGSLDPALQRLGPAFENIGNAIGGVVSALAPLAEDVGAVAGVLADTLATALNVIAALLNNSVVKGVIAGVAAFGLLTEALILLEAAAVANPIGLIAVAVAGLVTAIVGVHQSTDVFKEFNDAVKAASGTVDKSLLNNANTVDELGKAIKGLTDNEFTQFILKESEFAKDPDLINQLKNTGVSMQDLRKDLGEGSQGFRDFITQAIAAGGFEFKIDGVQQTVEDINNLSDAQLNNALQGDKLSQAFNRQQVAIERLSKQKLDNLVLSGDLTQAQVNEAIAYDKATGAGDGYFAALTRIATISPEAARQQEALAAGVNLSVDPLGKQAGKWLDLANAINHGLVTSDNFKTVFADIPATFGVSEDKLGEFVKAVEDGIDAMVKAAESKLPTVNDALQGIGEAADPNKLIENLKTQVDEIGVFTEAVRFLLAGGFNDVAEFLVQQGPKVGAQYVKALQAAGPATVQALETNLEAQKAAVQGADTAIRTEFVPQFQETGTQLGAAQAQGIAEGADFGAALQPKLNSLIGTIENDPELQAAAQRLGVNLNQIFSEGIDLSTATDPKLVALRDKLLNDPDVRAAARQMGIDLSQLLGGVTDFVASTNPQFAALQLKLLTDPEVRAAAAALGIDLSGALSNTADFAASTDPNMIALREFIKTQGDPNDPNSVAGASVILGGDLSAGIVKGVNSSQEGLNSAVANHALSAVFAAQKALETGSPSRVAARLLGLPISQGIALGITQGAADIDAAVTSALLPINTTLPKAVIDAEQIVSAAFAKLPAVTVSPTAVTPQQAVGDTTIIESIVVQVTGGGDVSDKELQRQGTVVGAAIKEAVTSKTTLKVEARGS